ncbi:MAG: nitroreductase family deazaflavin-dependent oxidoreductase [Anaerolineales bacterium]
MQTVNFSDFISGVLMQTTPETFHQHASGAMTYPSKGTLNRLVFKTPLILWRMGLGPILSHPVLAGSKMLALTTWGRKSHLPRHTMLSYVQLDDQQFVSSGWGARSDWYQNILVDPIVTVQVGGKAYAAKARRVEDLGEFNRLTQAMLQGGGDTHFEAWLESYGIEPNMEDMLAKRERLYLVALDAITENGPTPLHTDLLWVWGLIPLLMALGWWVVKRKPYCYADRK